MLCSEFDTRLQNLLDARQSPERIRLCNGTPNAATIATHSLLRCPACSMDWTCSTSRDCPMTLPTAWYGRCAAERRVASPRPGPSSLWLSRPLC